MRIGRSGSKENTSGDWVVRWQSGVPVEDHLPHTTLMRSQGDAAEVRERGDTAALQDREVEELEARVVKTFPHDPVEWLGQLLEGVVAPLEQGSYW